MKTAVFAVKTAVFSTRRENQTRKLPLEEPEVEEYRQIARKRVMTITSRTRTLTAEQRLPLAPLLVVVEWIADIWTGVKLGWTDGTVKSQTRKWSIFVEGGRS